MKKIELLLATLICLGFILKMVNIEFYSFFLILPAFFLSVIYFLFSFAICNNIRYNQIFSKSAYAHTSPKKIMSSLIFGLGLGSTVNGMLFTIQLYPGAHFTLQVGLSIMFISAAFLLAYKNKSLAQTSFYKNIRQRTIIIGCIGLLLYLTPKPVLESLF